MNTMNAVHYSKPRNFVVKRIRIPQITDDEVLLKVAFCGVCGSDGYIHEGSLAKFPLTPGHEIVGSVVKLGKNVKEFSEGDRCVVDPITTCGNCFYCRRNQSLLCEHFTCKGTTTNGGFAEYVTVHQNKLFKIDKLSDLEATLVEPAACAVHGVDKLAPQAGSEVLIVGAGPTGLLLAQLLKLNGAAKVVIAANKGIKTQVAKEINAGDVYIELDRTNSSPQWEQIKKDYPYGFDIVVEATGAESVVNDGINHVRRGGTLLVYGFYGNEARVHWPPSKIIGDEIRIIGSFAQVNCFPRAIAYLESGKINVKGLITDVFTIQDYQKVMNKLNSKSAVKIVVHP